MGQLGFFDLIRRYESLDEKSDPLVAIAAMVPFESVQPNDRRASNAVCVWPPFRAPNSTASDALLVELLDLENTDTDKQLLDLSIAATTNGREDWLHQVIADDGASRSTWRRRRAAVLAGFVIGNALPVDGAWPEGEICTAEAEHRRKAARLLSSEACAHHWWRAYLNAPDAEAAYAAWVLFIRSADRRAWVWFAADSQSMGANNALKRMKIAHTNLNKRRLTMAMEKREDKLDKLFLGRKTVDGVGPWGKVHG